MLGENITLFSINATVEHREKVQKRALQFRNCKVIIFGDSRIYSEFEEYAFDTLNSNYGLGTLEIELAFENNVTGKDYPEFFTKCFVLRTDTKYYIKPVKYRTDACCSKINEKGELVIGFRYFFKSEEDIEKIMNCNSILIESFIALEKKKNVYGIMCQLKKANEEWQVEMAYTYKPKYAKNIANLID